MSNLRETRSPAECTMLVAFADIAGFAKLCRSLSDQEIFALLSEFYEQVGRVIDASGGTVVKFMGDAALIVFPETAARQGAAALRELKAAADHWLRRRGGSDCVLHIQAHIGPVVCGPIGTAHDKRFDVLGNTVNQTAMLRSDGLVFSPELEQWLQGHP